MADERCEGCDRCRERCDYCGRFMSHWWFQTAGDEPDRWEDYHVCSQHAKHVADHPRDFGRDESVSASPSSVPTED